MLRSSLWSWRARFSAHWSGSVCGRRARDFAACLTTHFQTDPSTIPATRVPAAGRGVAQQAAPEVLRSARACCQGENGSRRESRSFTRRKSQRPGVVPSAERQRSSAAAVAALCLRPMRAQRRPRSLSRRSMSGWPRRGAHLARGALRVEVEQDPGGEELGSSRFRRTSRELGRP